MSDFLAQVGDQLREARRGGARFGEAWRPVIEGTPTEWREAMRWARKHFEAAYGSDLSMDGRLMTPKPDTHVPKPRPKRAPVKFCRSGDGCTRKAGHGRFGSFCKRHADGLKPLAIVPNEGMERRRRG